MTTAPFTSEYEALEGAVPSVPVSELTNRAIGFVVNDVATSNDLWIWECVSRW
jgi:hypothetical protein